MTETIDRNDKAVRVPKDLFDRAMALVPRLQATPWGDAHKWTAATMIRLALSRGLAQIEAELGVEAAASPSGHVDWSGSNAPTTSKRSKRPKP